MSPEIIALCAASLTTTSTIPQIIDILKTKNVTSIFLPYYLMLFVGVILWLIYGIMIADLPMILANIISLTGITLIIICKFIFS